VRRDGDITFSQLRRDRRIAKNPRTGVKRGPAQYRDSRLIRGAAVNQAPITWPARTIPSVAGGEFAIAQLRNQAGGSCRRAFPSTGGDRHIAAGYGEIFKAVVYIEIAKAISPT